MFTLLLEVESYPLNIIFCRLTRDIFTGFVNGFINEIRILNLDLVQKEIFVICYRTWMIDRFFFDFWI